MNLYRFLTLLIFFSLVILAFVVGLVYYVEFEPIGAIILFSIAISTGLMIRALGIFGARLENKICNPKIFLKITVISAVLLLGSGYLIYLAGRFIFSPRYLPYRHIPNGYEFFPWLYLMYINALIYSFAHLIYLASIVDVQFAKEVFIEEKNLGLKGYNYLEGGLRGYVKFIIYSICVGFLIFIGPIIYFVDVIRGRESPPIPLSDFIPLFLKVYIVATFPIGLILLVYSVVKILRRRYYTYLSNCAKQES